MYAFLSGSNKDLSAWEVSQVLKSSIIQKEQVFLVDCKEIAKPLLGSVIKIYKLTETLDVTEDIVELVDDSSSITISFDSSESLETFGPQIKSAIKNRFRSIKASTRIVAKKEEAQEILFIEQDYQYFIGKCIGFYSSKTFKELDRNRPARTFTHGTSPRLARIMVNLLGLPKHKTIVDPFCGTGTFLLELLRQEYNVIGIDNDQELVNQAQINIDWIQKKINKSGLATLIYGHTQSEKFIADGCVFEPYMGTFLKEVPNKKEAFMIIAELQELYEKVFKNLYKNLVDETRLVCILPSIPHKKGEYQLDINAIFKNQFELVENTYAKVENPIEYEAPGGSIIKRKIYILEKKK